MALAGTEFIQIPDLLIVLSFDTFSYNYTVTR